MSLLIVYSIVYVGMCLVSRPKTDGPPPRPRASSLSPVSFYDATNPPTLKGSSLSAKLARASLAKPSTLPLFPLIETPSRVLTPPKTRARFAKQLAQETRWSPPKERPPNEESKEEGSKENGEDKEEKKDETTGQERSGEEGAATEEEAKGEDDEDAPSAREVSASEAEEKRSQDQVEEKIDPGEGAKEAEADKKEPEGTEGVQPSRDGSGVDEEELHGIMVDPRSPGSVMEVAPSVLGASGVQFQASALLRKKSPLRGSRSFIR